MPTRIEWTDATWNPFVGCSPVSPGCKNCYAVRSARRQAMLRDNAFGEYAPLIENFWSQDSSKWRWSGDIHMFPERFLQPIRWRRGRCIFPCSLSDFFHEAIHDHHRLLLLGVMALTQQHIYQILTKRAGNMARFMRWLSKSDPLDRIINTAAWIHDQWKPPRPRWLTAAVDAIDTWPLPNVHLLVSCENQEMLDERVPYLLATPAAVRGVSLEPLLGLIDLRCAAAMKVTPGRYGIDTLAKDAAHLDWVIVGGESGPGARRCNVEWIRSVVKQCKAAGVPVFVKQLGAQPWDRNDAGFDGVESHEWPDGTNVGPSRQFQGAAAPIYLRSRKGGDPNEWPEDLRVREYPSPPARSAPAAPS